MKLHLFFLIGLFIIISSCKTSKESSVQNNPKVNQNLYNQAPANQPAPIQTPTPPAKEVTSGIAVQDEMERIGREKASMQCSLLEMKKESQSGASIDETRYQQIDENLKLLNDKLKNSYTPEQLQKIDVFFQKFMDDCPYKGF